MIFSSVSPHWFLAFALLLAGCSQDQPATTPVAAVEPAAPQPASPAAPVTPPRVLTSADVAKGTDHDTLQMADGKMVLVEPTDRTTWNQAPANFLPTPPDSADAPTLAQTGGRVQRQGMALRFKAANGRTVVLQNDTTDSENAIAYLYWGSLPTVHQWVVNAGLWEGRMVVLIDQRTGQRTNIWGQPTVAPDGRHILVNSCDLVATFDPNGFQLLQLQPTGPKLIWERELSNWGPADTRWLADGTVVVKQEFGPTGDNSELPARYVKLRLPPTL